MKLQSYLGGKWQEGEGDGRPLVNPSTGEQIASAGTKGIDMGAGLGYARKTGGASLRALSYAERANLLAEIAGVLQNNYEEYKKIAAENSGNTGPDADMDVGGAIFTLKYYSKIGSKLGDTAALPDGKLEPLSREGEFGCRHVYVPRKGVGIHINAFNFPSWGLWEKAACSLLAGVPVVSKPATATALLSYRMVKDVIDAGVLPDGALSIICGGVGDLFDHLDEQDGIAFTGSASTAESLRTNESILRSGARLTVEADSINACVLGPDADPDSPEFGLYVKEVARELTFKAGQKCTAIRRAFVPKAVFDDVRDALVGRLEKVTIGDPANEEVRMGPVVHKDQQKDVLEAIEALKKDADLVTGGDTGKPVGGDPEKGAFVAPTLLAAKDPDETSAVHHVEAFGPVSTLIPYDDNQQAFDRVAAGRGCLVSSVFTGDEDFARAAVEHAGAWNGRVMIVNEAVGKAQTGHGNVMPACVHGGPGRAGNGEELGGYRGLSFYHQRTAVQGPSDWIGGWWREESL